MTPEQLREITLRVAKKQYCNDFSKWPEEYTERVVEFAEALFDEFQKLQDSRISELQDEIAKWKGKALNNFLCISEQDKQIAALKEAHDILASKLDRVKFSLC